MSKDTADTHLMDTIFKRIEELELENMELKRKNIEFEEKNIKLNKQIDELKTILSKEINTNYNSDSDDLIVRYYKNMPFYIDKDTNIIYDDNGDNIGKWINGKPNFID